MPQGSSCVLDRSRQPSAGIAIGGPLFVFEQAQGARNAIYLQAYRELCEVVTGRAPSPVPLDEDEFAGLALAYLCRHHPRLRDAVRIELGNREDHGALRGWAVPVSVILSLAGHLIVSVRAGGAAAATWLCLSGVMDAFCECHRD